MKLIVEIKKSYGKDHIYPICKLSRQFADLLGTKTISPKALDKLKKMGYTFTVMAIAL